MQQFVLSDKWRKPLFVILASASIFFTPALSLFAGLVFSLVLGNPYTQQSQRISKKLLQYSVVGLGFGMNLHASLESGKEGMLMTVVSVTGIMVLGWILGRFLKLTKATTYLISAGTAICGGSAIAAVAPLTKSKNDEISVSLGTIFILNAIALFIFPPIGHFFGLSEESFGTWAAMAIHDTSSVVGAGAAYGEKALEIATTVKLTRALWIIPLAFVTSFIFKDKSTKVKIPWFILFFVLAMIVNTYIPLPEIVSTVIAWLAKKSLIVTLFLIGAGLSVGTLKQVGVRPMILGVALWVIIGISSLLVVL